MVRLRKALTLAAVLLVPAVGCVGTKPLQAERLNQTLKEALPSVTATPTTATLPAADLAPATVGKGNTKNQAATQFVTAWRSQLGQLPDPTKNGAMKPGIVGQVFLMTDKYLPAEITGSLTIAATDATDRFPGMPAKQPNAWHFDADTLKRMTVVDERFGKCVAVFLPWPEEWTDVTRLQIQARYDQPGPGTYTLYAPQSLVTLDFYTNGAQISTMQGRLTPNAMTVPDPRVALQQAKTNPARGVPPAPNMTVPPPGNPLMQAGFQQPTLPTTASAGPPAWPNTPSGGGNQGVPPPAFNPTVTDGFAPQPANGGGGRDARFVIPRSN